jgi:hypothetical protein
MATSILTAYWINLLLKCARLKLKLPNPSLANVVERFLIL